MNGTEDTDAERLDSENNDYVSTADKKKPFRFHIMDVMDVIHQLKSNKSADKYGIGAELFKLGP